MSIQRNTNQRRYIRQALEEADGPLSPQEVWDSARLHLPGIGIATVYRTIKTLVESGYLRPVELPGQPPRYEVSGKKHHHHFYCRQCSRVFEIDGCPRNLAALTPPGFLLEDHELVLYGLCPNCGRTDPDAVGDPNA